MNQFPEIISFLEFLDSEMYHICSIHQTFRKLYRDGQETLNLLNDSDLAFFKDLYIVYLGYISVAVSRLLDPADVAGKRNLSFFGLLKLCSEKGISQSVEWLERSNKLKADAYNFTDPRNQLVSHLDLKSNLTVNDRRAIPSFITKEFDAFYDLASKLLNDIRTHVGLVPSMYECGISNHGHGRKLLHRLSVAANKIEQGATANP